jgi:hypothetical protein
VEPEVRGRGVRRDAGMVLDIDFFLKNCYKKSEQTIIKKKRGERMRTVVQFVLALAKAIEEILRALSSALKDILSEKMEI